MRLARMFSSFLDLGPSCKTRSRRTWNTCADRPQDQVRERRKSQSRDQLRLCFEHIGGSQALCNHLRLQKNVNKMQIHTVINGFLYSNKVGSRSFFKGMSKMLLDWISEAKRIQFYFKKKRFTAKAYSFTLSAKSHYLISTIQYHSSTTRKISAREN